jgi:Tol biopolymer transport system component
VVTGRRLIVQSIAALALLSALVVVLTAPRAAGARRAGLEGVLGRPAWSPDGRHVAWIIVDADGATVWVAGASGRNAHPLHTFPLHAAIAPRPQQMAWETRTSLLVAECPRLHRLSLSGQLRFVASVTCDGFSIDAARRRVANGRDQCPNPSCAGSIRVIDLRSGKTTPVGTPTDVNYHAAISPNGRRVAYLREVVNEEGPSGIWLAPTSGTGTPHQIVPPAQLSPRADPVWSPDGRLITYIASRHSRCCYLTVLRLNGGRHRVGSAGFITGAVFSPDSRLLAYDEQTHYHPLRTALRVVNLRTGRIALRSPPSLRVVRGQAWSPDGTKLLITTSCGLDEANIRSKSWRTFRACH